MPRRRRPPRPGALADLAPLRILTQIALLQLFYYAIAALLIVFTTFVAGQKPTVALILDWHQVRGDVTTGWTLALCWMLDALVTVIPILLLIARSKLVPDFAVTIHILHLITTTFYTRSLPTTFYWWLVQACSAGLMVGLGMWACQWRELQPMTFGGRKNAKGKGVANGRPEGNQEEARAFLSSDGDAERGGGGEVYEMTAVGPKPP